jgi:hypothetical protein
MKSPRNLSNTPRGGWRFVDPVSGVPVSHPHHMAFLQKVSESRRSNGIPLTGNWEAEVLDEVCRQNPSIDCIDTDVPEIHMTADDVHRFLATVGEFKGSELVSEEEHRRRADICLRCPKMGDVNCKWCGWAAAKITELLAGRPIHRVAELHKKGCKACGCNLDTKTYYPLDVLRAVDQKLGKEPEYWEECWMREQT